MTSITPSDPIAGQDLEHRAAPGGALRVVEFVDTLETGGAQALLALRARHARRMGYRIDLVCLGACTVVPDGLARDVAAIHHFPSRHVFEPGRIARIWRLLRALRPDVVHTHLRTSNTVGALCGRLANVPVVATLHGTFPKLDFPHARRDWAERWALRLGARSVVAVGASVAATHRPRLGDKPVVTVPNPVELPSDGLDPTARKRAARDALELPFDPVGARIVITVGRLTRAKGVFECVRTLARLHRSSPGVKLLIVGDGHADVRDELVREIEAHGLGDSAFLLGRSERVRELMAASDVFLLGSRAEGLPLVLLEAMAMHLPIVATRVGDVPRLLGDGAFGRLIDPGDVRAGAAAIEELLDSPARARAVADRAYARARDAFSVERWLDDVDRLLRARGEPPGGEGRAADDTVALGSARCAPVQGTAGETGLPS